MNLGNKILQLRKKNGFSQEQLGEKLEVTRQTISNWELGETSPNPEQLKKLSKLFKISIDEMLENDINEILVTKISNTEKLAGMIIKILKVIGIIFIFYIAFVFIMLIVGSVLYGSLTNNQKLDNISSGATTICSINNQKYQVEFGTDNYFKCDKCSKEMETELKEITDFDNLDESMSNIENYFKTHNGSCE